LTLSWAPVANAKSYSVYLGTNPDNLPLLSSLPDFLAGHPEINFPVCVTRTPVLPSPFGDAFHFPSMFHIDPDGMLKLGTIVAVSLDALKQILDAAWPYEP
jgi:hypothetical protein